MHSDHHISLYDNRRLKDISTNSFVTHAELLTLLDQGIRLIVRKQQNGADVTAQVLLKLLCTRAASEAGRGKKAVLTDELLRLLVRVGAGSDPRMFKAFLDHSIAYLDQLPVHEQRKVGRGKNRSDRQG